MASPRAGPVGEAKTALLAALGQTVAMEADADAPSAETSSPAAGQQQTVEVELYLRLLLVLFLMDSQRLPEVPTHGMQQQPSVT
jgi:hypothetical protein